MSELKPCPFCGEQNLSISMACWSIAQEDDKLQWVDYWYVVCGKCGTKSYQYGTETLAAEAWNRRASDENVIK